MKRLMAETFRFENNRLLCKHRRSNRRAKGQSALVFDGILENRWNLCFSRSRFPLARRLSRAKSIEDMHDLCLLQVGIFCGPRASEVMGLQLKSWTGEALLPYGTAYEGQFSPADSRRSRAKLRSRFPSKFDL